MTDDTKRSYPPHPTHLGPRLTAVEQEQLWSACPFWHFRERLALALLLAMGLRLREVCALTWHDIQPSMLSVLGKDRQKRRVLLGTEIRLAMDSFVACYFSRDRDEHESLLALDELRLIEHIRVLGKRAGLDRPLSVHDLRRAAILRARAALRKGSGALASQKWSRQICSSQWRR